MPFVAKCLRCNYLMFADDSHNIKLKIADHFAKSHKVDLGFVADVPISLFCDIVSFTRITHKTLRALRFASRSPKFWDTYRNAKRLVVKNP